MNGVGEEMGCSSGVAGLGEGAGRSGGRGECPQFTQLVGQHLFC